MKQEFYRQLLVQLDSLVSSEIHWVSNLSNTAALLFTELQGINWAGFYLRTSSELILGPFQGKPACVRIPLGKGVCGTAAQQMTTIVVPDVHRFPGHIACDAASRSEIVIPWINGDQLMGVLDIDSPQEGRFDEADAAGLEQVIAVLNKYIDPVFMHRL